MPTFLLAMMMTQPTSESSSCPFRGEVRISSMAADGIRDRSFWAASHTPEHPSSSRAASLELCSGVTLQKQTL